MPVATKKLKELGPRAREFLHSIGYAEKDQPTADMRFHMDLEAAVAHFQSSLGKIWDLLTEHPTRWIRQDRGKNESQVAEIAGQVCHQQLEQYNRQVAHLFEHTSAVHSLTLVLIGELLGPRKETAVERLKATRDHMPEDDRWAMDTVIANLESQISNESHLLSNAAPIPDWLKGIIEGGHNETPET